MKINKNIWIAIYLLSFVNVLAQTNTTEKKEIITNLYVNPNLGKDDSDGTRDSPIKSLPEAAKRVNKMVGEGAIQVYLSAGTYGLSETAAFNPANWKFSKKDRLIRQWAAHIPASRRINGFY